MIMLVLTTLGSGARAQLADERSVPSSASASAHLSSKIELLLQRRGHTRLIYRDVPGPRAGRTVDQRDSLLSGNPTEEQAAREVIDAGEDQLGPLLIDEPREGLLRPPGDGLDLKPWIELLQPL